MSHAVEVVINSAVFSACVKIYMADIKAGYFYYIARILTPGRKSCVIFATWQFEIERLSNYAIVMTLTKCVHVDEDASFP